MESLIKNEALVTRTYGTEIKDKSKNAIDTNAADVSNTGIDIVLLHGWGMNSGAFSSFIPYLQDSFRVTTIDLPGFGENVAALPSPYTVDALAKLCAAQLPKDCVLIGWSLGGLVAQKIAINAPEKLSGLITIASTPRFSAGHCWPGIAEDLLNMFEAQLEKDYKKTLERFLAIQAMGSATAKNDIKTIRQQITDYPDPAEEALKRGLSILANEDLRAQIGRIMTPTLRLYGRLDSLVPTAGIDRVCELHPQADTVVMPHASHAPFISHPQQTADIIYRFSTSLQHQRAS
ncbi:pimeloyl-ACP methyl ester esterase BioH [Alteromonas sp. RW2A1]|uniref:pimeloyl-ACP methyl ester esterase BioH n=1 Tax=Alteromonas sp. RW2A1 TaxID=1917158 RepID=UPI0009FA39AC|nr:pimeloyl-ACP methyl ester esterase BioH [Alteromonas sp. RW2A1]